MKFIHVLILVAFVVCLSGGAPATAATPEIKSQADPLRDVMTAMDVAIQEVVSAIAQADGARVIKALDTVSGPLDRALRASQAGSISRPENGTQLDDFSRHLESFKSQVEALRRAGQRNDVDAMLMTTNLLLEGCISCHRTVRK